MNTDKTAWIIGAGSGIGRSVARDLGKQGWSLGLSGRRKIELDEVAEEVDIAGGKALVLPCDVEHPDQLENVFGALCEVLGDAPSVVVFCAGVNIPNRDWKLLDAPSAKRVIDINLGGAMNALCAIVPVFRERRRGTIVIVSSWAGWRFTPFTGPAYSAAKAGLSPIVESINQQEGGYGVRATLVCPAEVGTPILARRLNPPMAKDLARMLTPEDVARAVIFAAQQPEGVCINELVISPVWNRIYLEAEKLSPGFKEHQL